MKKILVCFFVLINVTSCSTWNKLNTTEKGAVIGGGSGAVVGGLVAPGIGGPLVGGAIGAIGGGVIGNEVKKNRNDKD